MTLWVPEIPPMSKHTGVFTRIAAVSWTIGHGPRLSAKPLMSQELEVCDHLQRGW
jgi:hypothetical protein